MLKVVSNSSSSSPSSKRELLLDLVVVLETALPLAAEFVLAFAFVLVVAVEFMEEVDPVVEDLCLPLVRLPLDLRGTQ